jgi:hypothetical protein
MLNNKIKYLIISVVFIFLSAGYSFGQFNIFKLFPSGYNQIEPLIVRHPSNPQILFASAFTLNATASVRNEGVYVSTNGGLNWFGSDIVNDGFQQFHNGDPGPMIDKDGNFIITHFQTFSGQTNRVYSNTSTNLGVNWTAPYACFSSNDSQDKSNISTDDSPSSPFYGRTYNLTAILLSPVLIVSSYTTNSGATWTNPFVQVNNSFGGRNSFGPSVSVGSTGAVYVSWAARINISPFNERDIGFSKSTNGGDNWNTTESIFTCNGINTSSMSPWGIRVNSYPSMDIDKSGGSRNGWIYILTTEKNLAPAGSDPDVILHRSTDDGNTWSSGIRVNQDPVNNGKVQLFPALRVDEDGALNVVYYDTRNTLTNDSLQVYISRSQDGGNTWRDHLITNQKYYPGPVLGGGVGNQGDNIGITSGAGKLYPVWMARYPGESTYQIWSAIVNIATIGINKIGNEIPSGYELFQNYPNPFNPETKIKYSIPKSSDLIIKLYDIRGKEIYTLSEGMHSAGTYEIGFNLDEIKSSLPSGIYFYRMIADGISISRKMILNK